MSERDMLFEVTTSSRIVGRKEDKLDSMSHVRAYPYSPGTTALQLRATAREGNGKAARQVYITALMGTDEVRKLRDHLSLLLGE